MNFWPFKKGKKEEHDRESVEIAEVRRRQRKVELELRTIEVLAMHRRGRGKGGFYR